MAALAHYTQVFCKAQTTLNWKEFAKQIGKTHVRNRDIQTCQLFAPSYYILLHFVKAASCHTTILSPTAEHYLKCSFYFCWKANIIFM